MSIEKMSELRKHAAPFLIRPIELWRRNMISALQGGIEAGDFTGETTVRDLLRELVASLDDRPPPTTTPLEPEVRQAIIDATKAAYPATTHDDVSDTRKIFRRHGCDGFWKEEYDTLKPKALIALLEARMDRALVKVISEIKWKARII